MTIETVKTLLLSKMESLLEKDLKTFLSDNLSIEVGRLAEIYKLLPDTKVKESANDQ